MTKAKAATDYAEACRQYWAEVEQQMKVAATRGLDLAVSEMQWSAESPGVLNTHFALIAPGTPLPQGARWTVYHTSRLPAGNC